MVFETRLFAILLLAGVFNGAFCADYEIITTKDGRRFEGYYDDAAGVFTTDKPVRMSIRLAADAIATRQKAARPDAAAAASGSPAAVLEARIAKLTMLKESADAEVVRLRKLADREQDSKATIVMVEQAQKESAAFAAQIDQLRADLAIVKTPTPSAEAAPKTANGNAELNAINARLAVVDGEISKLSNERQKLTQDQFRLIGKLSVEFAQTSNLSPVMVSTGASREDNDRAGRAVRLNTQLGQLVELRTTRSLNHGNLMTIMTPEFWRLYAEFKGPAPF